MSPDTQHRETRLQYAQRGTAVFQLSLQMLWHFCCVMQASQAEPLPALVEGQVLQLKGVELTAGKTSVSGRAHTAMSAACNSAPSVHTSVTSHVLTQML